MGRKTTGFLDSRASDLEAQMFGDVTCRSGSIQVNATKSDMAVGAHEVERGPGNLRACQFRVVEWIDRNGVDAQQIAESERSFGRRKLPHHDQVKSRVVEFLEQILDGAVRLELEPQPRKAIAG